MSGEKDGLWISQLDTWLLRGHIRAAEFVEIDKRLLVHVRNVGKEGVVIYIPGVEATRILV